MRALAGPAGRWASDHSRWQAFDRWHPLPLCIAVSLAAHLLLLDTPSRPPRQAAHAPPRSSQALQVRVLQRHADARAETTAVERAPSPGAPTPSVRSPRADSHMAPSPRQAAERPVSPDTAALAVNAAPGSSEVDAPSVTTPTAAATADHDEYVPRPLLSIPPAAQSPVIIAAPEGDPDLSRRVGILSLFIDEDGRVQHIAANEPALAPAFEQAARDAFMATRFSPGRIDGKAVKSRVRVEVVFDNTPLTSAKPPASP